MREEGWQEVRSRKGRGRTFTQRNGQSQQWRKVPRDSISLQTEYKNMERGTTFFLRNFPENCEMNELWWSFSKVGRVEDIFIPRKRDKAGKRFGFVRFWEEHNQEVLLEKLNQTWIDSYLLRAFIPRFRRKQEKKRENERIRNPNSRTSLPLTGKRIGGVSYSAAVSGAVNLNGRDKEEVAREELES